MPEDLDAMAVAYSDALKDIPDERLEECFARALRSKRDTFAVASADVLNEWDVLRDELRRQAEDHAADTMLRLKAGHGSLGLMTLGEFKERHNLPATWQLGQPYPPESDLYGKPLPPKRDEWSGCARCKDMGWLADRSNPKQPRLVKCPDCGGSGKVNDIPF